MSKAVMMRERCFGVVGRGRMLWQSGLVAAVGFVIAGGPVSAQLLQHFVEDPRPLSQAIDIIEKQCKCVITYEDPQYDSSQVVDVTAQVSRNSTASNRILVPRGSPFLFAYELPKSVRGPQDVAVPLETVLEQFHQSGNTIRFRLDRTDSVLHVVPEKGSILDVPVALAETEETADKMIAALLLAVSNATGAKIGMGTVPLNHLAQSSILMAANQEPAQRVLTRILQSTGRKVSWHLYFDYSFKGYALNLSLVDPATCITPDSGGPCKVDLGDSLDAINNRRR